MRAGRLHRWNGERLVAGGIMRRWTGVAFVPNPNAFFATGGTKFEIGDYFVHRMLDTTQFVVEAGSADVEVFLFGGGGAGSSGTAGGGGGGGVAKSTVTLGPGFYNVSVGLGGQAPAGVQSYGSPGQSTEAFGFTAQGGGYGARTTPGQQWPGGDGGNGGGACFYEAPAAPGKGLQGFDATQYGNANGGGGWGGAGAGGTNPAGSRNGGPGAMNNWLGQDLYYCGGGGGAGNGDAGQGGVGGGGAGAADVASPGLNGSGGGGGGGWYYANGMGARGGSGGVLVRYRR